MTMLASWQTLGPQDDAPGRVAAWLGSLLTASLRERDLATIALAGGRTPLAAYAQLARHPLDWSRVIMLPTDERCVPVDDPASNEGVLRGLLAGTPAEAARLLGLRGPPDSDAREAAALASRRLAVLPRPLDIVLLGMGEDGHVASLFPGGQGVETAMDLESDQAVHAVVPAPGAPPPAVPRLTLGLARLREARRLVLLIGGRRKRELLREALAAPEACAARWPVAALLCTGTPPLDVLWLEEGP
ncbi:MAG: 6-phosphogluconolactonase [Pseudomonadota bacterium]|jgi:6-phosphogluconolactonase